jgi:hypothetical protein
LMMISLIIYGLKTTSHYRSLKILFRSSQELRPWLTPSRSLSNGTPTLSSRPSKNTKKWSSSTDLMSFGKESQTWRSSLNSHLKCNLSHQLAEPASLVPSYPTLSN